MRSIGVEMIFSTAWLNPVEKARQALSREFRKVLILLAVVALIFGAAKASYEAGLGDSAVARTILTIMAVPSVVLLAFLAVDIGSSAPMELREGYKIHGLSWGAKSLMIVVVAPLPLLLPFAADRDTIWFWMLEILSIVGALYILASTFLYQIVWDKDVVWARDRFLRWRCHKWGDLIGIDYNRTYAWDLRFVPKDRVEVPYGTNSVQAILDHAQIALNQNEGQRGDDA